MNKEIAESLTRIINDSVCLRTGVDEVFSTSEIYALLSNILENKE